MLRKLLVGTFEDFVARQLFDRLLGKNCVDSGQDIGIAGADPAAFVLAHLRKPGMWPLSAYAHQFTPDDVFDVVEFLHDHVAQGTEGWYHGHNRCGTHYTEFDTGAGQRLWREALNPILRDFGEGYELTESGEVVNAGPEEMAPLLSAPLPGADPDTIQARVSQATDKFRRRGAQISDRRDAVRDLADVLEYLRPQLKIVMMRQDESDLFNIVNNFGIRHHNQNQRTQYDEAIWLNWMFYFYLATIHTAVRLIARAAP